MIRSLSSCSALVLAALSSLAGCAFSSTATRAKNAPDFAPATRVELAKSAPPGAVLVGTVEAVGNQFQGADDCAARLERDARELGASHVVVTHSGRRHVLGYGATCRGDAYRVAAQ